MSSERGWQEGGKVILSSFGNNEFEIILRHPNGDLQWAEKYPGWQEQIMKGAVCQAMLYRFLPGA